MEIPHQTQLTRQPNVKAFFHPPTFSYSYVVSDPATKQAAVIDAVADFDMHTGTLSYEHTDKIVAYIKDSDLTVQWVLETHMHADHVSAATYIQEALGGQTAIGKHIATIQGMYQDVFSISDTELAAAAARFDRLWEEEDTFMLGTIPAFTFYAPGHTPADIVYGIGDALFVGDSLFMPDFGSARCDFPNGSSSNMYDSVQKILALPEDMRMFMCHDYLPEGRDNYQYETTVGTQKRNNIHLREGVDKATFVAKRDARDATLPLPKLMIPSLQLNVRAGAVPEENGKPMLRLPVNSVFSTYIQT